MNWKLVDKQKPQYQFGSSNKPQLLRGSFGKFGPLNVPYYNELLHDALSDPVLCMRLNLLAAWMQMIVCNAPSKVGPYQ